MQTTTPASALPEAGVFAVRVAATGRCGRSGVFFKRRRVADGRRRHIPFAGGGRRACRACGQACRSAAWGGGERTASVAAPAKLLYKNVLDNSVRSRAEGPAASRSASCSPPPRGGCGLPIPFGIEAVRPTATRALLGAKPAERTHACQSCGPPLREAAARRTYVRFPFDPQPSGGTCREPFGELQTSARGRLRAAALSRELVRVEACEAFATSGRVLRPADGCDVEPCAFMRSSHGQQLAKGRGVYDAGLRGAKLRPAALKRESVLGPKPAKVSQQFPRPSADRFAVASRLRASTPTMNAPPKKSPKNEPLRPITKGLGIRNGSRGPLFRQVLPYRMRSAARTSISSRKIAREASHTKKSAASGKAAVSCGAANEAVAAASAKRAFRRKK